MNFNERLGNILKKNNKFHDGKGELLKQKVKTSALSFDEELIKLLIDNNESKEYFFKEISKTIIFDYKKFIDYIDDKNFLLDSYTKFSNKVGLTISNKYIKQIDDVVLSFPFKDCVLEGGQSNEEERRKEIFFNEVLAKDEINRLLDKKVITNAIKYYYEDGEVKQSNSFMFNRDNQLNKKRGLPEDTITDNLIIKGNNLLVLHTLKSNFAGKIKLIYIDPPYNTGDDGFGYNDSFSHSTWLTFMKNRLEIARELLSEDGVIFVQIDNSPNQTEGSPEFAYLAVLMDEIFGRKNYLTTLVWKKKGNASNTETTIGTITENILMYSKSFNNVQVELQEFKRSYKYKDENGEYNLECPIKTNSGGYERTTMLYPVYNPNTDVDIYPPKGKRWTIGQDTLQRLINENKVVFDNNVFYIKKYESDYINGSKKLYSNLLDKHGSLKLAKDELQKLGFDREEFGSPKPEILLDTLIDMVTKENDIVLDFFLGSGTTCAVAHKKNRQYIGIEQMDYIDTIPLKRLKNIETTITNNFIYFELAKYNQSFIEDINNADETNILNIYDDISKKGFLNYDIDLKIIDSHIDEFKSLSLRQQKEFLISILNKNQLYINLSEIEDDSFKINTDIKNLNKEFYNADFSSRI
ncbi:DNA methyltransferase [Aliarcobacter butzleri]|uniref:DNA methyltransferase n=1 Tax=Aliarcobacter butzleri TaxID=28197 RepID=UPI0019198D00|nr:site-specific DNA-methyltransferase [Aliarcobacter butzleri]